uniref:Butyrophilin subfamily 1 member A1-like isoform X1 n=1 Tax=Geotrypetes seraphini TaxID=260995 RepID=A0A6P8P8X8_GEOSA|nr:butyrophilin subfamily 1 member A1-like isoform X1 [Geotrypetes seraphini]
MGFPESPWRMSLSSLPGFIFLLISHHFQTGNAVTEHFKVTGPDQPVVAVLGEDAVLLCRLSPALSAQHMQVRWFRKSSDFIVHRYENGMDQNERQNSKYRGRTELIKDCISSGSVPLRIRNIGLDDEGIYTCFFELDTYYEKAVVELKVAGLGSAPSISLHDHQDRELRVLCESSGWYPEPVVAWRQEDGQSLMSLSETETEEQNGLFKVKSSLLLRTNQHRSISCRIRNIILSQDKESVISIADTIYQRVSRWIVSLTLILMSVLISCGLLVVLFFYHLRKERKEKAKLSADNAKFSNDNQYLLAVNAKLSADNAKFSNDNQYLLAVNAKLSADNAKFSNDNLDVTLDPETAHPYLLVSEDRKSVTKEAIRQILPDDPERFDTDLCVLGCQRITSGRHYWEVEVGAEKDWAVGVCKDSVKRKGRSPQSPGEGYWGVALMYSGEHQALTHPRTPFYPKDFPHAVGILLDYETGMVSFYNADNKAHLFTFTDTFSETLRPFLYTYTTLRIRQVAD